MELSVFAMVLGNVVFFAGLGFYLQIREGWAAAAAAAAAGSILASAALATTGKLADPLLLALFPVLSGLGYAGIAAVNYVRGQVRPDLTWRGHTALGIVLLCGAGAAAYVLVDWPLRFQHS